MNDWVNAEQHAERARTFYQNGEWDKALAELSHAIALNPEQGEWHFGKGLTLDALHRYAEAVESYEESLRLRGDDPEVMMHIGIDLIHLGRHEEAIESLERCNKINPQFEPGYCFRVAAYAHLKDHDKAEEMFYLARQVQEECPSCYDHLAHSLQARGQTDKAIWCWQQTLRLAPDHHDVRAHLGHAHWQRGQVERANVLFEQQLAHHPNDLGTRLRLGRLQMETERFAEAARTFRTVVDVNPKIAEAHDHLGELALKACHYDEAAAECEMAAQLNADLPGVHHRWALAELHRGRLDRARPLLVIELDKPDHSPAEAVEISRTLMDLGMMSQAIALLSRVVEESDIPRVGRVSSPSVLNAQQTKSLAAVLLHRGYAFLVTQRRRAGIDDCRKALKMMPGNALTLHNLALAYVEEGQLRRADYYLRLAVALRPKDPMIKRLGHRIRRLRLAAWFKRMWKNIRGQR